MQREEILNKVRQQYEQYPFPVWGKDELANTISDLGSCFQYLKISPRNKNILDVGCGTGLISAALAMLGGNVKGIDISERCIEIAKQSVADLDLKVDFERQDLFSYNSPTLYDFVFCIGVLHHTYDPYAGFCKLTSLTQPGGYMVIGLYSKYSIAYKIIDVVVRKRFQDTKKGLAYIQKHKAFFSLFHHGLAIPYLKNTTAKLSFLNLSLGSTSDEYLVDKFCHAQRSYHTLGEVKKWMRNNRVEYLGLFSDGSVPQTFFSIFFFFNVVGKKYE